MRMTTLIAAAAALSMAAAPAVAGASSTSASKLSVTKSVRASSPTKGASKAVEGPALISGLALGGLLVAGIVVAATSGGDDDTPDSP